MFARDAEPIANVPPLKRVDLNPPRPADPIVSPTTWEICDALMKQHEANRIWELVKQTASGTNAPEYVAPSEDCA